MQLLLAVVCDDAQLNAEGKLDLRGIYNDLYAPGFPAKQDHMTLVIVVEWDREDEGRYLFRVELRKPGAEPVLQLDGHSDVDRRPSDRPPPRTRLIVPIEEVIFPEPGAYDFQVTMKGRSFVGPSLYLVEADRAPAPA